MNTKPKTMTITQLQECIVPGFVLRTNNPQTDKLKEEYAKLMKEGVNFGAVKVAIYPPTEQNETGKLLIDGWLRVYAAEIAGVKSLPVEEVEFKGETPKDAETLALAEMLRLNINRGKEATAGERDKRIRTLSQRGLKNKRIGELVDLTEASISRILRGLQKKAEAGKGNVGKTHEDRAARGSADQAKVRAVIGTIPGFYEALKLIPLAVEGGAAKLLTAAEVQHVGIIENAMKALKGLHDDLVKALHLARPSKKAA